MNLVFKQQIMLPYSTLWLTGMSLSLLFRSIKLADFLKQNPVDGARRCRN